MKMTVKKKKTNQNQNEKEEEEDLIDNNNIKLENCH